MQQIGRGLSRTKAKDHMFVIAVVDEYGAVAKRCSMHSIFANSMYVPFLHTHNMYNHGLVEDLFDNEFNNWYRNETSEDMSKQRIHKALKNLYDMESVAIVNGEIRLLETVWRNRLTS